MQSMTNDALALAVFIVVLDAGEDVSRKNSNILYALTKELVFEARGRNLPEEGAWRSADAAIISNPPINPSSLSLASSYPTNSTSRRADRDEVVRRSLAAHPFFR